MGSGTSRSARRGSNLSHLPRTNWSAAQKGQREARLDLGAQFVPEIIESVPHPPFGQTSTIFRSFIPIVQ